MSSPGDKPKPTRKVQVGAYKLVPPRPTRTDAARESLAGRAKRHLRGLAVGPRKVTDPDEEVRILRGTTPARRPFGAGLGLDDDE